jgi:hypothetical protein
MCGHTWATGVLVSHGGDYEQETHKWLRYFAVCLPVTMATLKKDRKRNPVVWCNLEKPARVCRMCNRLEKLQAVAVKLTLSFLFIVFFKVW